MTKKLKLFHHHAFKCAGTTFSWSLKRNFGSRVLFVEGSKDDPGRRFGSESIHPIIDGGLYDAGTSHLMMIPKVGENIADIHFSLIREPFARIVSAYYYLKRRGACHKLSLEDFCDSSDFQVENFQSKHAFVGGGDAALDGWGIDQTIYQKIDKDEIFFGIVEYYDGSMVLLESMMSDLSVRFDASYGIPSNRTRLSKGLESLPSSNALLSKRLVEIIAHRNQFDIELYRYAQNKLLNRLIKFNWEPALENFLVRRQKITQLGRPTWFFSKFIRTPPPKKWVYIFGGGSADT